jgi:hypothetical protein
MNTFLGFITGIALASFIWLSVVSIEHGKAEEYDTAGLLEVIKANQDARPVILTTEQQNAILKDIWEGN